MSDRKCQVITIASSILISVLLFSLGSVEARTHVVG